ncbi:MAG TPA: YqaJ viral recombinase family protein [Xanthobacteraceae bacterium]|jgi:hypothetical protein
MIEHVCEQNTDDWYRVKLGIPSASQAHNIITPLGAPTRGDRRRKYMYRLIAERLLKQSMDDRFENFWTRRGKDLQDQAAEGFLAHILKPGERGVLRKIGFITTDDGKIGASPDRILRIGKKREEGVELKCPSPWVQIEYLLEGTEENYKPQVQMQILVGQFKANHLWCFHPNMPPVHVVTLRDDDYIKKLARALFDFCNELDAETDRAQRKGPYKLAELLKLSSELGADIPGTFPWLQ